jgi:hypothetical protein
MNKLFVLLAVVAFATALRASADTRATPTPRPATERGDATTPSGVPIVAVGCVNRSSQNGSMTGTAVAPPATPETAGRLANSSELTNSFVLNGATQPDASDEARALASSDRPSTARQATYVLDGTRSEIEHHVGNRVEVTGTLLAADQSGGPSAPASTTSNIQHIQVASLRMIAASCAMASPDSR